jgi:hypothetical protein
MTEEAYNVVPRPHTELCWVNAQVNTVRNVTFQKRWKDSKTDAKRRVDLRCVWKTQLTPNSVKEVVGAWIGS